MQAVVNGLQRLKEAIIDAKKKNKKAKEDSSYIVPYLWTVAYAEGVRNSDFNKGTHNHSHTQNAAVDHDFFDFHLEAVEYLLSQEDNSSKPRINRNDLWASTCYNLFVRYGTAYSHNSKSINSENNLYRNKGTLLKAISLLPYLSSIGFNHIHLLPVTAIGKMNRKGDSGSPYAIKNHLEVEAELSEPSIGLTADELFQIFVQACHRLGISVSTEFIFRTASVDSDLALDNPDWFYWISNKIKDREADSDSDAKWGRPNFSKRDLKEIKARVAEGIFSDSIKPKEQYRNMFTPVPQKVARADGRIVGFLNKKDTVRVPYGFADWPPDDKQPEWSDVTYLKLYEHPDFNYIAYDTVRMYDTELTQAENENKSLWSYLADILPNWIERFDIDGALLDMAHALPEKLLSDIESKVRQKNEQFFFLGEFFYPNEFSNKYFDGIMGGICLCNNSPEIYRQTVNDYLNMNASPYFLSGENHNTKRVVGGDDTSFAEMSIIVNSLLPGMFTVLNGTEVMDSTVMNTGLGFTFEDIENLPTDKLPLFSSLAIDWSQNPQLIVLVRDMAEIRKSIFGHDKPHVYTRDIPLTQGSLDIVIKADGKDYSLIANTSEEELTVDYKGKLIYAHKVNSKESTLSIAGMGVVLIEFE